MSCTNIFFTEPIAESNTGIVDHQKLLVSTIDRNVTVKRANHNCTQQRKLWLNCQRRRYEKGIVKGQRIFQRQVSISTFSSNSGKALATRFNCDEVST